MKIRFLVFLFTMLIGLVLGLAIFSINNNITDLIGPVQANPGSATFYPNNYTLLGSTTLVSGSLSNVQSDDSNYMTFRSYVTQNSTGSFGSTASGNFSRNIDGTIVGSVFTVAENAWADNITAYVNMTTAAKNVTCAIYYHGNLSLVAQTQQMNVDVGTAWRAFSFDAKPWLIANTEYLLVAWSESGSGSALLNYVNGSLDQGHYVNSTYSANFPSTLPTPTHENRAYMIYLNYTKPTEYTSEVEFLGNSNTESWTQLVWAIDNSFTTTGVTGTFQLYNYQTSQYPLSGDGYMADTIGTTDITKTQPITTDPAYFRDANGNWKLKIKGAKSTNTQFDFKADLTKFEVTVADTTPPTWSNAGTNNTLAGQPTLFSVRWTDDTGLSGFIFGTNNTGTWSNDTWTPMSGTVNWSNVTKILNSVGGAVVQWRVWANDTSNNWNDTGILSLTTQQPPVASFTHSPATSYTAETVTFNASASYDSDGTIVSYFWNFGDGTNSTGSVVTHMYAENGDYAVTLEVTDNDALTDTDSKSITILNQAPVASFTESATSVPTGTPIYFNASASYDPDGVIVSYMWNFGDGNITTVANSIITHVYSNFGNYTITLTVTDSDTLSDTELTAISIRAYPTAVFSYTPGFPFSGDTVTFDASLSSPNGGTIIHYVWNFGDGTPLLNTTNPIATHVYVVGGTRTVTLTVTDSEELDDTETHSIVITGAPIATFTYSPASPVTNETTTFDASGSYDSDGSIVSYVWDFGDDNITTVTTPIITHIYWAGGNFTVVLTVTDNQGLTDTTVEIITVSEGLPPTASFTYSPTSPYMGDTVVFNASSSRSNGGEITSYIWNFGDGSPSANETDPITTHVYIAAGNYTVTLTIEDSEGLSDTTSETVTIAQAPVAIFTYSTPIINEAVTFNASGSYDPNGYIVSYIWNFGDGNITTQSTPIITHKYASFGIYRVVLTVSDNEGYADVETATIRIIDYPTASFTFSPTYPIIAEAVAFDASTSTPNGGQIISYIWNFGDDNITTTSQSIITHTYLSVGNYTVTLTVTDDEGLSDTNSTTLMTRAYPEATFVYTPSAPNANDTITFDASSSVANGGTITSYIWNFGDGSSLVYETDPITTYVYTAGGNYTVTLTIIDSEGLNDTASANIMIGKPPVAVFTYSPDSPIAGQTMIFNMSNSYDLDGYIANYTLNFGDGNITTVTNPIVTHVYQTEGNYTVVLKVTDNDGMTNSTTLNIRIRNYPSASFTFSPVNQVAGKSITFDASSSSPHGGSITNYQWDFGDGNVTTSTNPIVVHTYLVGGNYTVTLTVTDSEGLNGSLSRTVRVRAPPVASFIHSPEPSYIDDVITFNASASYDPDGYIMNYAWDFGDGTPLLIETDPVTTYVYGGAGNYTVVLTVTDNEGINSTKTSMLTVLKAPVAVFNYSPNFPIVYEFIVFNASSSHDPNGYIANYTWDFGDGHTITSANPIIDYAYVIEGNYTVRLTVMDNDGFTDTTIQIVRVRNYPTAAFVYSPDYPVIDGTVAFNASQSSPRGGVIVSYVWDFGDGNQTTVTTPILSHAYSLIGNYTITLTVTDSEGLSSFASQMVSISPRGPTAKFTVSPSWPKPEIATVFNASVSTLGWNGAYHPPIVSYIWDFGDGNQTTVTTPVISHIYSAEDQYVVTLRVVDSIGLEDETSRVVGVTYGREDVDGDGRVDMLDISLAIDAFMTYPEHPLWDPRCDVNLDGAVDMADLSQIITMFGTGW